jgi:capsular exopolysaccharide synthesis family protein
MELSVPAGPSNSLQELVEGPANLVTVLWRRRRLVGASVLACFVLAVLYLLVAARLYQATARLLVLQQGGRPLNVANAEQGRLVDAAEDIIPTHMVLIGSPVVVRRAIESVGVRNLPSLGPGGVERCLREAAKNLTVTRPDRQAKILQVDYRAKSPAEAVRMVQAILASYKTFLEDVYQKNNSEVVVLMTKARDDLNSELKELERKYLEFHQKAPNLTTDASGRPIVIRRVDEWVRASNEAMVKAIQLKSQLELGRKLAADGVGLWAIAGAMDQIGEKTNNNLSFRTQGVSATPPWDYLRQLNMEQQQLAVRFGPQNTKVKEIQEQIGQVQEHSRSVRGRVEQTEIRDLLESTERSLKSIETMRASIAEQFNRDLAVAKSTEIDLLKESALRNNLDRERLLFNTVVDQLKQARLVGDYSSIRSEVVEPANALPSPVRPFVALTLVMALVVGGVLGAGGALVSELLDPRIRSVEELRRAVGFPLLGQVPQLPDALDSGASPAGLVSHVRPRSPSAEAFKVVRANLDLSRRNRGVRVVLVTSARPGEGKSTVASNLAVCLAQVGRRVLLVDADLRGPAQHLIHGLRRERGLVHVLRDLMAFDRVVQATPVKDLDLVASGPETPNPAELLSSPLLPEFLDRVREQYDTVVIDSPPLLEVADPAILGALADGILLVARVGATTRDDAARAVEVLKGLGTPVLGGLVNGIGAESDPVPWPQLWRIEKRSDRYVREIRIDSQLIFVPGTGSQYGAAPVEEGPRFLDFNALENGASDNGNGYS